MLEKEQNKSEINTNQVPEFDIKTNQAQELERKLIKSGWRMTHGQPVNKGQIK